MSQELSGRGLNRLSHRVSVPVPFRFQLMTAHRHRRSERHDGFVSRKEILLGGVGCFQFFFAILLMVLRGEKKVGNVCLDASATAEIGMTVRRRWHSQSHLSMQYYR